MNLSWRNRDGRRAGTPLCAASQEIPQAGRRGAQPQDPGRGDRNENHLRCDCECSEALSLTNAGSRVFNLSAGLAVDS
jgi:hypothetical protein